MVMAYGQDPKFPMIIFSTSQDTDSERNEVPGCRFRKVSFYGTYSHILLTHFIISLSGYR